MTNSLAN